MKYAVILCDGMADLPLEALDGKTPMEVAEKPNMDRLAKVSRVGRLKTVAEGMTPGSDVANLACMGYDPAVCYTGRAPLEALNIGIPLTKTDLAIRCNLVTLTEAAEYSSRKMADYCAGDISTEEARQLIKALDAALGTDIMSFHTGTAYRHILVLKSGTARNLGFLTPPHDVSGRVIGSCLPSGEASFLRDLMEQSVRILSAHPVNKARVAAGKRPANAAWFWGQGSRPALEPFVEKTGLKGAVVSAVDLIKGIGRSAGMRICEVPGATGYLNTNFSGKAEAAVEALKRDCDYVYIHLEAPDECGHRGEVSGKIEAIEKIDKLVVGPVAQALADMGPHKILILPDHPTPLSIKTHTADPVPFLLYDSSQPSAGPETFTESTAGESGWYISHGADILRVLGACE